MDVFIDGLESGRGFFVTIADGAGADWQEVFPIARRNGETLREAIDREYTEACACYDMMTAAAAAADPDTDTPQSVADRAYAAAAR